MQRQLKIMQKILIPILFLCFTLTLQSQSKRSVRKVQEMTEVLSLSKSDSGKILNVLKELDEGMNKEANKKQERKKANRTIRKILGKEKFRQWRKHIKAKRAKK